MNLFRDWKDLDLEMGQKVVLPHPKGGPLRQPCVSISISLLIPVSYHSLPGRTDWKLWLKWVVAVTKTKPVTTALPLCRLKNPNLAEKVLTKVTEILENYPFDFKGARIITGIEEGAYGWITINYLLGKFTKVIMSQHPWSGSLGAKAIAVSGSTWIACQSE